jgi:hypothetical protein
MKRFLAWTFVISGIWSGATLTAFGTPVSLGGAADYAIFGVGGLSAANKSDFEVYQSDTVVNGNVGMGPFSLLTHNIDATINGRFDYDTTASLNGKAIVVPPSGGVHQINLSTVAADARNASMVAAALVPTQTFATLTEDQVIVGNGGLNVIRVTGDVTLKKTLSLQGGASDSFVFQFTSTTTDGHDVLELSGMNMILSGGVLADNILWNLFGLGGGIDISAMAPGSQKVYGTFLAPDRDIIGDHAIVDGRLIGGGSGNLLSVHSSSEINQPQQVPDNGRTIFLLGGSLIGLFALNRRFNLIFAPEAAAASQRVFSSDGKNRRC